MSDLEVEIIKIQINMKKEQNLNNTETQVLNIPVVINRDLELNRITEMLEELRQLRNNHNDGYRTFYNSVCDRLDVLQSKLIHGL